MKNYMKILTIARVSNSGQSKAQDEYEAGKSANEIENEMKLLHQT